jgi:predicted  nucleic acid-binding Zn-ribbon protein
MTKSEKLPEELVKKIESLTIRQQETIFKIGDAAVGVENIKNQLSEAQSALSELFAGIKALGMEEESLMAEINEKYSNGVLDLDTMTFTPE